MVRQTQLTGKTTHVRSWGISICIDSLFIEIVFRLAKENYTTCSIPY